MSANGGSALDGDTNGSKDLIGFVEVRPFREDLPARAPIEGLTLRVGGSTGEESATLLPFRTSVLQPQFAYGPGVRAEGRRRRVTPSILYWHSALGAWTEYFRSTQRVALGEATAENTNTGWAVTGSCLLTGEAASTGVTRPRHDLDLETHHWGAFHVIARYSVVSIDAAAFGAGMVQRDRVDIPRRYRRA